MREIVYAARAIAKMPVLATVVVVSLAIGIGVNTAVFSWIQLVVLRPLPGVADAGSFHFVEPRSDTGTYPGVSWPEYGDLRERLRAFPDVLAFRMVPFDVGERGRVERRYGLLVSGNYFAVLGLQPALGRFIRPDEVTRPGTEPVVVVGYDYWQTRLAGAADVIGRTIRVNDRLLTIVGVAPDRFQGTVLGLNFDLWAPATLAPALFAGSRELDDRALRGYAVMGRLQTRTSQQQAQAEVDAAIQELARTFPETNARMRGEVRSFWQAARGPQQMLTRGLVVLQSIMLLLLLAVCGNTANLLLARASTRQREVGVRLALGAGPWRIAGSLLAESLLLAAAGAAVGVLIAVWGTNALRAVPVIGAFPIKFQTSVDATGLAFAALLALACGVTFGLAPAVHLARVDPQAALRSGARTAARSRLRHALMAVEVALAVVVLLAAGLFYRSFHDSRDIDPGFRREGVLLAAYDFSVRNPDSSSTRDLTRRLLERLQALPGVESAAIAASVPLDIHGLPLTAFTVEGRATSEAAPGAPSAAAALGTGPDRALMNTVTPDYFRTMGIPLLAGPGLASLGDQAAPPQVVVNEAFVRRFVADGEPIGRRVTRRNTTYLISGVVRNSVYEAFGEPPIPIIYFAYRDRPSARGEMHLRTRPGAEALLAPQIERAVRDLDPLLPVFDVRTLSEHIEKNLFLRRIPARMFVVLGPALLVLAAIGIYAVVAYTVARRTTEIGVRLALGATTRRVVAQMIAETLRVIVAGALAGWTLAFLIHIHLVRGPIPLSVFVVIPGVLLLVATAACWLPAQRAARLDPVEALREN